MLNYFFSAGIVIQLPETQSHQITPENLTNCRHLIQQHEGVLNHPFGQWAVQIRRSETAMLFAVSKSDHLLVECAVAREGDCIPLWREFCTRYKELRESGHIFGSPAELPAPESVPWIAAFFHNALARLKQQELLLLSEVQVQLALAYIHEDDPGWNPFARN